MARPARKTQRSKEMMAARGSKGGKTSHKAMGRSSSRGHSMSSRGSTPKKESEEEPD
jgi:hypothetical protein